MTAAGDEGENHMIIGLKSAHAGPHFANDSAGFVAEHHGHLACPRAIDHREIRMTQTGAFYLHKHLAFAGAIKIDFLNDHRLGVRIRQWTPHFM